MAVAAGGAGISVTFRPRPAPPDPLRSATTVGVRWAVLLNGLLPRVGPSRISRRRWVRPVTTPSKLGTVGTLGAAANLGRLGAPNRPFLVHTVVTTRPLPCRIVRGRQGVCRVLSWDEGEAGGGCVMDFHGRGY